MEWASIPILREYLHIAKENKTRIKIAVKWVSRSVMDGLDHTDNPLLWPYSSSSTERTVTHYYSKEKKNALGDILQDAVLLMQSMPWSGDVVPVLHSCSPSTPSAAVPAPSMVCHCLGLFVHPSVQKSRVNQHFHLPHAPQTVGLLLDYLAFSI